MAMILQFFMAQFQKLTDITLTASIVILFVLFVRLLLKKAPKIFSYALWGIVLLRLLVPVSLESPLSIIPQQQEISPKSEVYQVLPEIQFETPRDQVDNQWYTENTLPGEPVVQVSNSVSPETYLTFIWLLGMVGMVAYACISYGKLRRKIRVVMPLEKGIYLADDISTPFVMGILRPAIFLPGTLGESERKYIIAHEQHHIRRGDHIFKALGFLALTVHWFNPLVWVAFALAGRDMEMSCDEAVVRKLGGDIRADYSASLLNLAAGRRVFSITPLAFGETNPTGRVRNLAKWKKPALWVIIICMILCVVLAVCLLTDREAPPETDVPTAETVPTASAATAPPETAPTEADDWGIFIKPEYVSRTGLAANFVYSGSAPLSYGDFLTLEQLADDNWVPVEELEGYRYYVGDSSYPVMDGYGMVHEWGDRFGELADGHYRVGKKVTHDGTGEERMVYGEFSIPDSIRVGYIPLEELPNMYSAEQAMLDGCFVQHDGVARDNKDLFQAFASRTQSGEASFIRIVNWYYGETSSCFVQDLTFDGSVYTLTWVEDGTHYVKQYRYLKHFTGEKETADADYDSYEHYVLVNDETLTWESIRNGLFSSQAGAVSDHYAVYSDYVKRPVVVQLPLEPTRAVLEFEGKPLITVTDSTRLENIYDLFDGADVLGYEPKTHSTGVGLHLVLTFAGGETVTIDLDPQHDICKIGGEFVFYGAFDEPDYIEKLWDYLDISAWSEEVYAKYPEAYRM